MVANNSKLSNKTKNSQLNKKCRLRWAFPRAIWLSVHCNFTVHRGRQELDLLACAVCCLTSSSAAAVLGVPSVIGCRRAAANLSPALLDLHLSAVYASFTSKHKPMESDLFLITKMLVGEFG